MKARLELTDELDRVVCAVAIRQWRPGGPFDLEDVKQIARLAALEALPKHDGSSGLPGFVSNAARWRIADRYRREAIEERHRHWNRGELSPDDDHSDHVGAWEERIADPHDFTDDSVTRIDALELVALMSELRPRHRRVLVALYLVGQNRPYAQVAAELGLQIDALKSLRRRALAELRRVREERQFAA